MEKPGSNEEIQLVAILRILKKTQDEVAGVLHLGKKRVGDIENWIRAADLESVEALFDDHRLQQTVEKKLTGIEDVEPLDLVRTARLTAEDILQRYREDYLPRLKQVMQGGPGPGPAQTDPVMSKLCQDHQNDLILLVERLSAELGLALSEFRLRNLNNEGTPYKSSDDCDGLDSGKLRTTTAKHSSLFWEITKAGTVHLCYPLEVDQNTRTRIMRGYLEQHLDSSVYFWLLEDEERGIAKWKQLGGEELEGRTRLLNRIDRAVEKLTSKPLTQPDRMICPGPSTWFSESIWSAALDGFYRTLGYKVEPFEGKLLKVQYGATLIGLTVTNEESERYIEWHKDLMVKCEKRRTTIEIKRLRTKRESIIKAIRETLTKFVVNRHIPGKCDYDFCQLMVTPT